MNFLPNLKAQTASSDQPISSQRNPTGRHLIGPYCSDCKQKPVQSSYIRDVKMRSILKDFFLSSNIR